MKAIFLLTLLSVCFAVHAQRPDSLRTQVTKEIDSLQSQPTTRRFIKAYRKFIQAQVEEKTLIKIGALPQFGYAGYVGPAYGVSTQVGIEHKLVPALSVLAALHTNYARLGNFSREVTMRSVLAGRWYYAQNRRMRSGLSANNFSNQYLTIQTNRSLLSRGRLLTTDELYTIRANDYVSLSYGIQRRLGQLG